MGSWVQDPDCIAAWLFAGEVGGDDAVDSSPLGVNVLTDLGAVACLRNAAGKINVCLETDGASEMGLGILDVDQVGLNLTWDDWSILFWVKSDGAWPGVASPSLICKGVVALAYHVFRDGTSRKITGVFSDDGSSGVTVEADGITAASTWLHVAFVRHKDTIKLYIDGELQADEGPFPSPTFINSEALVLAAPSDLGLAGRFDGFLDEVALFKRALTATDLAAIIRDGLGGAGAVLHEAILDIHSMAAPEIISRAMVARTSVESYLEPEIDVRDMGNPVVEVRDVVRGDIRVSDA